MGLFKRKNIYYIRIKDTTISTHTKSKRIALSLYKSLLKEIVIDSYFSSSDNGQTAQVSQLFNNNNQKSQSSDKKILHIYNDYIKTSKIQKLSEGTIIFKELTKKLLVKHATFFYDIDQKCINEVCEDIEKYADDTKRKFIAQIKAFLNNSIKKGLYSKTDYERLDFPVYKTKPKDLVITPEELEKIFDYTKKTDKDLYMYLYTLYHTYSRPGEVIDLKVSDFDFATNTAIIFQNKTQKNKKVYLHDDFCNHIQLYISENNITDYIFQGRQYNKEYYSKKFRSIKYKTKINTKINLYTFRHTAVTDLMNKTNDIEFVAKQAGNTTEVALKHYVNRNDQHYKDMMKKI